MLRFHLLPVVSFLVFFAVRSGIANARSHNVTLKSTAKQIVWSPALCNNASLNKTNCTSAWRMSNDVPGTNVTSTNGPDLATGSIIPQMFLTFRGSAIYIRTSSLSTAITNMSLSSASSTDMLLQVNSSIGWISAIGLPNDVALTLALTYVPDLSGQNGDSGRLDIRSIIITVPNVTATSSYLPSIVLPTASTPPTFSHSSTSTPVTHKKSKGAIIGQTVGPALGAILLISAGAALVFWRQRRRRVKVEENEIEWSDYERGKPTTK